MAQFNKPLMIVEMGVAGTPEEQKVWLQNAFGATVNYPLLTGIIYFNVPDIHSWASFNPALGKPDWTVNPAIFL